MRSVVDRNVVMRRVPGFVTKRPCELLAGTRPKMNPQKAARCVSTSHCECGRSCWPNRQVICSAFAGIHRPSLKDGIEKSKLAQVPVK